MIPDVQLNKNKPFIYLFHFKYSKWSSIIIDKPTYHSYENVLFELWVKFGLSDKFSRSLNKIFISVNSKTPLNHLPY